MEFVLDSLKDQERAPDPELLNELGWNQDDVRRFLARWEKLRADAKSPDRPNSAAQKDWRDALRSLGWTPGQAEKLAPDRSTQVQQQHTVPPLPPAYRRLYQDFKKRSAGRVQP